MFILHYILGFSSFGGLWRTTVSTCSSSPTYKELRVHNDYDSSTAHCVHHPAQKLHRPEQTGVSVSMYRVDTCRSPCSLQEEGSQCGYRYVTGWGRCCSCGLHNNNNKTTQHIWAQTTHTDTQTLTASCTCPSGTTLLSRTPFPWGSCDLGAGVGWLKPFLLA